MTARVLALVLLLAVALPGTGLAQKLSFEPFGYGGGGRFTTLAVDPHDPKRVLVGSDVAGYFLSTDGGDSFMLRGKELNMLEVSSVVFHPDKPGVVAVQSGDGLYLSKDGGMTLTRLSAKAGYHARFFGCNLVFFQGPELYAATENRGVFVIKWEEEKPAEKILPGVEFTKINGLTTFEGVLWAATDRGLYRLQGERFEYFDSGLPQGRRNLTDLAAGPKTGLFVMDKLEGLFRFDAAVGRFVKCAPLAPKPGEKPVYFKSLALDPYTPGRIMAASDPDYWPRMLYQSKDGGASFQTVDKWVLAPDAPPNWATSLASAEAMAFSPNNGPVFVSDWWNVWRSTDGGETFNQLHKGLLNTVVNAIVRHPAKPGTIYAGTADNGVMITEDGGKSWFRSMKGAPDGNVMALRLSEKNPDKVYFLFEPWVKPKVTDTVPVMVCKSADGGKTWKQLPFAVPAKRLTNKADGKPTVIAVDPRDDETVYVGLNGHGLYRVNTKLLSEGKEKEAVESLNIGLLIPNLATPDSLLIAPDNPEKLYVSTQGGGVWMSENAGKTWFPSSPRYTLTFGLAADPSRPGRLYAALPEKRIIVSDNGGRAWREIILPGERPPHIAARVLAVDLKKPDTVYVGTSAYDYKAADGLYVSRDAGQTFAPAPSDLPRVNLTVLTPSPDGLLIGTNGMGIFKAVESK